MADKSAADEGSTEGRSPTERPAPPDPAGHNARGNRRLLGTLYAIFALAATSRAAVQLGTQFHDAPLAYSLSLLSGVVYIAATVGFFTHRSWSRPLTWFACSVELAGVLAIGTASLIDKAAFPHDTVWSRYGSGYGFIPVVLPILGLWWLYRGRASAPASAGENRH
ncbi:MAG: hypothetical protein M3Y77_11125 [Actinomycetota bacterium]|nr:hypothetical protein [Actinomycetota bacterium]